MPKTNKSEVLQKVRELLDILEQAGDFHDLEITSSSSDALKGVVTRGDTLAFAIKIKIK